MQEEKEYITFTEYASLLIERYRELERLEKKLEKEYEEYFKNRKD